MSSKGGYNRYKISMRKSVNGKEKAARLRELHKLLTKKGTGSQPASQTSSSQSDGK